MDVVLDYNIVFSALQGGRSAVTLFSKNYVKRTYRFLVPEFFYREFKKHLNRVKQITKLGASEFDEIIDVLMDQLVTVPDDTVMGSIPLARRMTPDPKDVPYVALTLALNIPLLTGDMRLVKSVKGRIKVLTLQEALELV